MMKSIIFFGDKTHSADKKFNEWAEQNPNVYILDVLYQQTCSNEHSICVFYEESKNND